MKDMTIILDRSGSMSEPSWPDTLKALNEFIDGQKEKYPKSTITLVSFDNEYDVLVDQAKLEEIKPITDKMAYPRGGTALFDAIGKTLGTLRGRLDHAKVQPDQVLVVVVSDGGENASDEWRDKDKIKAEMDLYKARNWEFIFIGAEFEQWGGADVYGASFGNLGAGSLNCSVDKSYFGLNRAFATVSYARDHGTKEAQVMANSDGVVDDETVDSTTGNS